MINRLNSIINILSDYLLSQFLLKGFSNLVNKLFSVEVLVSGDTNKINNNQ
jgi:hypothetical protein